MNVTALYGLYNLNRIILLQKYIASQLGHRLRYIYMRGGDTDGFSAWTVRLGQAAAGYRPAMDILRTSFKTRTSRAAARPRAFFGNFI